MKKDKKPIFISACSGNSFFDFIKKYCLDEASGKATNRAFHRLCSLMRKMNVMSIIVEHSPVNDMLKSEISALETYYGQDNVEIHTHRITFVDVKITEATELHNLKDENFLSSCILINFKGDGCNWISYIYQSFVSLPKINLCKDQNCLITLPLINNYIHLHKIFACEVAVNAEEVHHFNLIGTFFCQQNTVTSVCAHAAICMAINNMTREDISFVTPEDVNGILDIDHHFKKIKLNQDFHKKDFEKVFTSYKLFFSYKDFPSDEDYDAYIYRFIESRCPTLLVFSTKNEKADHVVPIFGHTLNRDMWTPEAKIIYSKINTIFDNFQSTVLWVDHFVIHDDNLGMYYCLPTYALKNPNKRKKNINRKENKYSDLKAKFVISIVPDNPLTSPREAQLATASVLDKLFKKLEKRKILDDNWIDTLRSSCHKSLTPRIVAMRTFLVSKKQYIESLNLPDFKGQKFSTKDKNILTENLPDRFWLSEITLPDIFTANRNKIIDFFYPCNIPSNDNPKEWKKRWIQIRLPGALYINNKERCVEPLSVKSHYPLVRLDVEQQNFEW